MLPGGDDGHTISPNALAFRSTSFLSKATTKKPVRICEFYRNVRANVLARFRLLWSENLGHHRC